MVTFTPKSEQELSNTWPKGEYAFEIISAEDKISISGNEMIALELWIFNAEGKQRKVKDYLMEKLAYKLKHCAEACGLDYNSGRLEADDFIGKTGTCKVQVQKDPNGLYGDKNVIADYVVTGEALVKVVKNTVKNAPKDELDDSDSIPF
jgi:hypothetical protein